MTVHADAWAYCDDPLATREHVWREIPPTPVEELRTQRMTRDER